MDLYEKEKSVASEQYERLPSFLSSLQDNERCELILHELAMLGVEPNAYMEADFTEEKKDIQHVFRFGLLEG